MSMIMGLYTIGDGNIERMRGDPPLYWRLVEPDDPDLYRDACEEDPGEVPDLDRRDGEGEGTDLDKAWHGLHYLFTGTAWEGDPPLDFLVAGGEPLAEMDNGYGPPRLFRAAEVARIEAALSSLENAELASRFRPPDMLAKEIYPTIWDRPPAEDDTFGYLMDYLEVLREFLARAVRGRFGILIDLQ